LCEFYKTAAAPGLFLLTTGNRVHGPPPQHVFRSKKKKHRKQTKAAVELAIRVQFHSVGKKAKAAVECAAAMMATDQHPETCPGFWSTTKCLVLSKSKLS
jgi:hypothetical protein